MNNYLLFFVPLFISTFNAYAMDAPCTDEQYQERKKSLLTQAQAVTVHHPLFFEIFFQEFPHTKVQLQECLDKCKHLHQKVHAANIFPEHSLSKDFCSDVCERLNMESNLLMHARDYFFTSDTDSMVTPATIHWEKKIDTIISERKKTLALWPEELRQKYPTFAIATFLNEVQSLIIRPRPYINPEEFLAQALQEHTIVQQISAAKAVTEREQSVLEDELEREAIRAAHDPTYYS